MPAPESGNVSYIRAVREVEVTPETTALMLRIQNLAHTIFEPIGAISVAEPLFPDQELLQNSRMYKGVAVHSSRIFPVQALWVTLFERRAPASDQTNEILLRSLARVTKSAIPAGTKKTTYSTRQQRTRQNLLNGDIGNVQANLGLGSKNLQVRVTEITRPVNQGGSGIDYGLVVQPDEVLAEQGKYLNEKLRTTPAARPLFFDNFTGSANPNIISIGTMPVADKEAHELFMHVVSEALPVTVELKPVEWTSKIRTP